MYFKRQVEVTLEPRFPLFGGWKTKAVLGYSLPLQRLVTRLSSGGLKFGIKFGSPFPKTVRR